MAGRPLGASASRTTLSRTGRTHTSASPFPNPGSLAACLPVLYGIRNTVFEQCISGHQSRRSLEYERTHGGRVHAWLFWGRFKIPIRELFGHHRVCVRQVTPPRTEQGLIASFSSAPTLFVPTDRGPRLRLLYHVTKTRKTIPNEQLDPSSESVRNQPVLAATRGRETTASRSWGPSASGSRTYILYPAVPEDQTQPRVGHLRSITAVVLQLGGISSRSKNPKKGAASSVNYQIRLGF